MKKTILIIPGLLTDIKNSGFSDLTQYSDKHFDIIVYDTYGSMDSTSGLKGMIEKFQEYIDALSIQNTEIYLITHSSGSELVLHSHLNHSIKGIIFWSPSLFVPQNISRTLIEAPEDSSYLIHGDTKISKALAYDMDHLDTAPLISLINRPYKVYLSKEDAGQGVWKKYTLIPYRHNYTKEEIVTMLNDAKVGILRGL